MHDWGRTTTKEWTPNGIKMYENDDDDESERDTFLCLASKLECKMYNPINELLFLSILLYFWHANEFIIRTVDFSKPVLILFLIRVAHPPLSRDMVPLRKMFHRERSLNHKCTSKPYGMLADGLQRASATAKLLSMQTRSCSIRQMLLSLLTRRPHQVSASEHPGQPASRPRDVEHDSRPGSHSRELLRRLPHFALTIRPGLKELGDDCYGADIQESSGREGQ